MRRFKNILAYVQGAPIQDIALARAVSLAIANKARLTMIDVVGDTTRFGLVADELQRRQAELDEYAAVIRSAGLEVSTLCTYGRAAEMIIRHAAMGHHDLVLKTANPEDNSQRRLFGTTATALIRMCPCPVWVVRRQDHHYHRILAAIDPVEIEGRNELNRRVLEIASSLAISEGGELHVVHVWEAMGQSALGGSELSTELGDYVHSARSAIAASVEDYLREQGMFLQGNGQIHLPRGTPWQRIPEVVMGIGADVIVMGTVGRQGVLGYVLGNTAERVLPRVPASVIVVKRQELVDQMRQRFTTEAMEDRKAGSQAPLDEASRTAISVANP